MRTRWIGAVALGLALTGQALPQHTPKQDPLQAEFQKLQNDYNKAQEAYYKPFEEAKTDEDRAKIRLDPAQNPNRVYFAKAMSLEKRARMKPGVGATIGSFAFNLAMGVGDRKASDECLADLKKYQINSSEFGRVLGMLEQYAYSFMPNDGDARDTWVLGQCDDVLKLANNRDVQAMAILMKAQVYAPGWGTPKDASKGREYYVQLKDKYSDTDAGKQATGAIFRIDNLQIGMVAPDIEATDQDGKAFKVSNYRGKVVVLDFWGFW